MKLILSILICAIGIFINACDGPTPTAIETCSDIIQNQGETDIDCGGPCIECFDCFTDFCKFLSGGEFLDLQTSRTWDCTLVDGEPCLDESNFLCELYNTLEFTFSNKGSLEFIGTDGPATGRWYFDNPEDPTKIHLDFPPTEDEGDIELELVSLQEGKLEIFYFGATGTFEIKQN